MKNAFFILTLAAVASIPTVDSCQITCDDNHVISTATDYLFLLDVSRSMCVYHESLSTGVSSFINGLWKVSHNFTIGLATFADSPTLIQPLMQITNQNQIQDFAKLIYNAGCYNYGQEAGLEAIRMALTNNGADMLCSGPKPCNIGWRDKVKKYILLLTDEDSDRPTNPKYYTGHVDANLYGGQSGSINIAQANPSSGVNNLCCTYTDCTSSYCTLGTPSACAWNEDLQPYGPSSHQACDFEPAFTPITSSASVGVVWYNLSLPNYQVAINQRWRSSNAALQLAAPYVNEISVTAQLVYNAGAIVSIFTLSAYNNNPYQPSSSWNAYNPYYLKTPPSKRGAVDNIHTANLQYGLPSSNTFNSSKLLNIPQTIANNNGKSYANNLQHQILLLGGVAHAYEITSLINFDNSPNSAVVQQFFASTLVHSTNCNNGGGYVQAVDCVYTWVNIGSCHVTSTGNATQVQTQTISITTPAQGTGKQCPPTGTTRDIVCNVNCVLDTCRPTYSTCIPTTAPTAAGSVIPGTQSVTFPVIIPASGSGTCNPTVSNQPCTPTLDCTYTPWTNGSNCNQYIDGNGITTWEYKDTRSIAQPAQGGGYCAGLTYAYRPCVPVVNCVWGPFVPQGTCQPQFYANGTQISWTEGVLTSTRTIVVQASGGGTPCTGSNTQTSTCTLNENCTWGPWYVDPTSSCQCYNSDQSLCDKDGSYWYINELRTILHPASGTGTPCSPSELTSQLVSCTPPPQNCQEEYEDAGNELCIADASTNFQTGWVTEKNIIDVFGCHGGRRCSNPPSRKVSCVPDTDCVLNAFGPASACVNQCGITPGFSSNIQACSKSTPGYTGWVSYSYASVKIPQVGNGKQCPSQYSYSPCIPNIDCQYTTTLGHCQLNNDLISPQYVQTVSFTITTPQSGYGQACPKNTTQYCNDRDCILSSWSAGACDLVNGNYQATYTRTVVQPQVGTGFACDTNQSYVGPCIPTCTYNPVTVGQCLQDPISGNWIQTNITTVLSSGHNNSDTCLPITSVAPCLQPLDCLWGNWVDAGPCTLDDDGIYRKTQTRTIYQQQQGTGKFCSPNDSNSRRFECDMNCVATHWVTGKCIADRDPNTGYATGTGIATDTRTISVPQQQNGLGCGPNGSDDGNAPSRSYPCVPDVDCVPGPWQAGTICQTWDDGTTAIENYRNYTVPAYGNGQCVQYSYTPCQNCQMSDYVVGKCLLDDDTGYFTSFDVRQIVVAPSSNGNQCGPLYRINPCNPPAQQCKPRQKKRV